MSATIKENTAGKIFSSDNNRLKLLNFVIPASMVYHKISINTSNNTIVHNYKIINDSDFSTLNNYINAGTYLTSENTDLHPTPTQSITQSINDDTELSTCKINQNTENNIIANQLKIASCQIKTATKLT